LRPGLLGTPGLTPDLHGDSMLHVLASENAVTERKRLLGQARHCRDLADTLKDEEPIQELAALAKSYEAIATLIVMEH